jgi:regulator of protease activity HflC (stomatin/prohibitin superfamily)
MGPLIAVAVFIFLIWIIKCLNIMREYERAVVFRLGHALQKDKGPGVILILWPIDRIVKVSLRIVTWEVPPQDVITRDNVSLKVNAVVYFRVISAVQAIIEVENYRYASEQLAQTTLRSVLGEVELDDLLAQREKLNTRLQTILDEHTEPWGVKVTKVEVKQVYLPQDEARHSAPGGGRARATRQDHRRPGRVPGLDQAGGGGGRHPAPAGGHHPALPPDARRAWHGEEHDDRLSLADRVDGGPDRQTRRAGAGRDNEMRAGRGPE